MSLVETPDGMENEEAVVVFEDFTAKMTKINPKFGDEHRVDDKFVFVGSMGPNARNLYMRAILPNGDKFTIGDTLIVAPTTPGGEVSSAVLNAVTFDENRLLLLCTSSKSDENGKSVVNPMKIFVDEEKVVLNRILRVSYTVENMRIFLRNAQTFFRGHFGSCQGQVATTVIVASDKQLPKQAADNVKVGDASETQLPLTSVNTNVAKADEAALKTHPLKRKWATDGVESDVDGVQFLSTRALSKRKKPDASATIRKEADIEFKAEATRKQRAAAARRGAEHAKEAERLKKQKKTDTAARLKAARAVAARDQAALANQRVADGADTMRALTKVTAEKTLAEEALKKQVAAYQENLSLLTAQLQELKKSAAEKLDSSLQERDHGLSTHAPPPHDINLSMNSSHSSTMSFHPVASHSPSFFASDEFTLQLQHDAQARLNALENMERASLARMQQEAQFAKDRANLALYRRR
jgi:hypothetical protein